MNTYVFHGVRSPNIGYYKDDEYLDFTHNEFYFCRDLIKNETYYIQYYDIHLEIDYNRKTILVFEGEQK